MSIATNTINPFDLNKASSLSDSEILQYWVDILDNGGLVELINPRSLTPIMLLGGKGSGKTHLLRYCSAAVQSYVNGSLRHSVEKERFLGVYVPAEGLNTHKFSDKGQLPDTWASIFALYFEIWLVTSLVEVVEQYILEDSTEFDEAGFIADVVNSFDADVTSRIHNFRELHEYLVRTRKEIDYIVNNSALTSSVSGIEVPFSQGRLLYGIPESLARRFPHFSKSNIVYLIDEVENLTADQQKFLNTLIRYRKGNSTIRIGARLYGVRTHQTLGSGEPIRRDAEYQQVILDDVLRTRTDEYKKLAYGIIAKRIGATIPSTEDIENYFERADRDQYQRLSLSLAEPGDRERKERPYFRKFRKNIELAFNFKESDTDKFIVPLQVRDNPFLEKANIFMVYKDWPSNANELQKVCVDVGQQCEKFAAGGRGSAPSYSRILDHFSSDLFAQLCRDFRTRVPYAGLKSLLQVSQGIPRNLLTILRNTYRRSLFLNESPFSRSKISVEAQSDGVRDSTSWFWEDAQPDGSSAEVRDAVEALGLLFRSIRYSDRPAECDVCTFSVNVDDLTPSSRHILMLAENWSYLIQMRDGARNKNDRGINAKYQLGPMLAPKWDLSENRRGNIELGSDLANAIFDQDRRDNLAALVRARISGMNGPHFTISKNSTQGALFQ